TQIRRESRRLHRFALRESCGCRRRRPGLPASPSSGRQPLAGSRAAPSQRRRPPPSPPSSSPWDSRAPSPPPIRRGGVFPVAREVGDGDQVVFAAELFRLAAPASPADATRRAVDSAAPAPIRGFLRPAPLLPHVRSFPRPAPLLPLVRAIRRRAPAILPQSASSSVSSLRPCAPLVDVQQNISLRPYLSHIVINKMFPSITCPIQSNLRHTQR
ncbi:unnamed protein product, partial [Urochloa humidicola]